MYGERELWSAALGGSSPHPHADGSALPINTLIALGA